MADGRIMNLMSALHKDNSGLDLRNLIIGAEGTLGIITAAVLKLRPKPQAYATAMIAVRSLSDALTLLNRLQTTTGYGVEAFEYVPRSYIEKHQELFPDVRPPFEASYDVNIMIEVAAVMDRDAVTNAEGETPVVRMLEDILGQMLEDGHLLDAVTVSYTHLTLPTIYSV